VTATREELLRFADCCDAAEIWHAAHSARLAASKLAPSAPDDAPRFKVGDRVRVRDGAWMRVGEAGEIDCVDTSDATMPYRVVFSSSERAWFHTDELTPADAPDDEGLSEVDAGKIGVTETSLNETSARLCDAYAKTFPGEAPWFRMLAREIRTALANGAGEARAAKSAVDAALIERLHAQRDALRAELDEAKRELGKVRAASIERFGVLGEWRDWAWNAAGDDMLKDSEARAAIDAKFAAAKPERLGRRDSFEAAAARLEDNMAFPVELAMGRISKKTGQRVSYAAIAESHRDAAQHLRELAATLPPDTEPVFTVDDAGLLGVATRLAEDSGRTALKHELTDLADRLAAFVRARGETEAGK
jgi:hypothetical protein